jgi:para-aminobenzoate synthetase/4-amino-4-deoxychorismate lyase
VETLKWEPEAGFVLLKSHLARLEASARFFYHRFDGNLARAKLDAVVQNVSRVPLKVRLLLSSSGDLTVNAVPLDADPLPNCALVRLANSPVNNREPMLFHKTTNRELYQRLLDSMPDCYDVLLWNEDGFVTELTRFNVLAFMAGQWKTPPIRHGLLRGTLCQELLRVRLVEETDLTKHDIRSAQALVAINSVRGLLMLRPQAYDEWLLAPIPEGPDGSLIFRPLIEHVHQVTRQQGS